MTGPRPALAALLLAAAVASSAATASSAADMAGALDGAPDDSAAEEEDNDRDGWPQSDDCNDGDARANPGEPERCRDGIDNDCDGYADDLDADCLPADDGCSHAAGRGPGGGLMLALAAVAVVSARRGGRPARSSRRCRA